MFLGNLSMNTERQARKASSSGQKITDDKPLEIDPLLKRLSSSEAREILYTAETAQIPREVLLEFLKTCVRMLQEDFNLVEIINESVESKQGLHLAAVEFQRDVLEYNFGIERNFGCKYLAMLSIHLPDDTEVIEAAKLFMFTCMRSYVNALKYRNKLYKKGKLQKPGENEAMSRAAILEFFEGCNALMVMPETKEELKSIYQKTKKPPNERIVEMQRNLIKLMGYNVDYGVQCLSRVQHVYPNDREIMMRMQYFMVSAELACRESMFSDEERADFYRQIPPLMQHFPHIHVLQQRMAEHQHGHAHPSQVDQEARAKEIEALKKSGILTLISSPEGRVKMQDFAIRVQGCREKAIDEVNSWDEEKRTHFFTSFLDHPLLTSLGVSGGDPSAKINALLELHNNDLEDAMKFVAVVGRGEFDISKKLAETKGGSENVSDLEATLRNIQTTLGSLANLKPRNTGQSHDHNHDHGHSHSQDHSQKSWDPLKPDISRGKVDKMER